MRATSEKTRGWRDLGGLMRQQPYEQCLSCKNIVFPLVCGLVPHQRWRHLIWFPISNENIRTRRNILLKFISADQQIFFFLIWQLYSVELFFES